MQVDFGGSSSGPFAGLTVVDFSNVVSGPLCGQIFGDLGAEVVKVEALLLGETPAIYFTHFWGKGPPGELARGLRAALDAQNSD